MRCRKPSGSSNFLKTSSSIPSCPKDYQLAATPNSQIPVQSLQVTLAKLKLLALWLQGTIKSLASHSFSSMILSPAPTSSPPPCRHPQPTQPNSPMTAPRDLSIAPRPRKPESTISLLRSRKTWCRFSTNSENFNTRMINRYLDTSIEMKLIR